MMRKSSSFVLGALLAAAMPVWAGTARDARGSLALDSLPPGALAATLEREPAAGDPRLLYFVITKGTDPDFQGMGGKLEAAWKNRRLVRVPVQALQGLARHPDVLYLREVEYPRTAASRTLTGDAGGNVGSSPAPLAGVGEVAFEWTTGTYTYDGAGNIKEIGPDSAGRTQSYVYDGLGRLRVATANTPHELHAESYVYDAYGNMTAKTTDGSAGLSLATNPATNQLTGLSYDEAGNVAQNGSVSYAWDGGGMLKELESGIHQNGYIYTPDDERLGVTNSGGYITWTVRDFGGKVIREYESAGGVYASSPWLWVEDYAHGLGRVLVSERESEEGGRRHYHTDHLGSTRLVTTDDGIPGVTAGDGYRISEHVYFPFGVEATRLRQEHFQGWDRETRLKYTGHERDYLGGETVENTNYLDYMHARYYNPNLGRFLSVDPGNDWDPAQPQSWNSYAYVRNNPLGQIDPNGKNAVLVGEAGALFTAGWLCAASPACSQQMIRTLIGAWDLAVSLKDAVDDAQEEPVDGEVVIDGTKHPESAQHAQDAQDAGHPAVMTIDRGGAKGRRQQSMQGTPRQPGKDRDEYPPAVAKEGGKGASVRPVRPGDNRGSGGSFGQQLRAFKDGARVTIRIIWDVVF